MTLLPDIRPNEIQEEMYKGRKTGLRFVERDGIKLLPVVAIPFVESARELVAKWNEREPDTLYAVEPGVKVGLLGGAGGVYDGAKIWTGSPALKRRQALNV